MAQTDIFPPPPERAPSFAAQRLIVVGGVAASGLRAVAGGAKSRAFALMSLALAALIVVPMVAVIAAAFGANAATLVTLWTTVLPAYLLNTLMLAVGVGLGVTLVGVSTAWLVTMCRFPGRAIFEWALIVPLAMPAYIIAYAYTDLLSHPGIVQSTLRDLTGWGPRDYWFPNIRSTGGAILMFTLVLYPYVYLLARQTFLEQSGNYMNAARSLGLSPVRTFFEVALPLARPAIVGGATLALMETLADFGTVSHFGVQTFTTGIYRALYSMYDDGAAAQLAALLLGIVALLILLERLGRGRARYFRAQADRGCETFRLRGWRAALAMTVCGIPVLLGFVAPVAALMHLATIEGQPIWSTRMLTLTSNSLTLASLASICAVTVAAVIALAARFLPGLLTQLSCRLAALGYAVPGSVIAVGVLVPLASLDRGLKTAFADWFGLEIGLLLVGSIAGLVFAYVVRFLAVALNGLEASLTKIPHNVDSAARVLGETSMGLFRRVHIPLLAGGLMTAALMVFVDVMKELPATLIIRPFNYDTLAIHAYRLASDERLAQASSPALVLVAVGLVPVFILSRRLHLGQASRANEH